MSDPDRPNQGAPSLGEVVGTVLGTVVEIGCSLLAAGRGVLAMASRLVRLAQEQWLPTEPETGAAPSAIGDDAAAAAPPRRAPTDAPPSRQAATSAVAFDAEPLPPPAVDAATPRELRRTPSTRPAAPDLEPETPPLPERYGVDRLGVLARDPDTIFAWWEVSDARRETAARELEAGEPAAMPASEGPATTHASDETAPRTAEATAPMRTAGEALRVAPIGEPEVGSPPPWIVPLPPLASSWYVEVPRTSQRFEVTLGLARDGRFVPLVAPQRVETPACEVSRDESVRWRAIGEAGDVAAGEPVAPTAAALWEEIRRQPLPASADWPPSRRLADLELGGSHTAPRA